MGGLVADGNGSPITDSYWNITTSGQATTLGNGTGLTTAQAQVQINFVNFDFVTTPVWKFDSAISIYPVLNWQQSSF